LATLDTTSTSDPPASREHIGFIGSSNVSKRALPAGWEVPRLLEALPSSYRATVIATGDGLESIAAAANTRGVHSRLRLLPGCPPGELPTAFEEVGIAISSQTFNLAGEARTTGKLPDYLAMGKVVVSSRVGTAGAILPPKCTVVSEDLFSDDYVRKAARAIDRLASLPADEWSSLSMFSRSLASRLFSAQELGTVWRECLEAWEII
jgi:hypothetical protein